MAIKIYLSPSNHGVNQNKCLRSGCYEDKHTRAMAESASLYLKASGFEVKIADDDKDIAERCREADEWETDLLVPIHTNAFSKASVRYLMFMFWADTAKTRKIFNAVAPELEAIYPEQKSSVFSVRKDLIEINTPKATTMYIEAGFHTNQIDVDNFIHNPEAIGKALAKGICNYYGVDFKDGVTTSQKPKEQIVVDGLWGCDCTRKSQKVYGTSIDGIISNQLYSCRSYLVNCMAVSWEFENVARGGSAFIKAVQRDLKAKGYYTGEIDGYCGKQTVIAIQKFLNAMGFDCGTPDGYMGVKTVKAWQAYINSRL